MAAPEMAITAFLGGGGRVFRRVVTATRATRRRTARSCGDAMHFSDLRRGQFVEDSVGFSGDDFFNACHAAAGAGVRRASGRTCVLLNPHTTSRGRGERPRPPRRLRPADDGARRRPPVPLRLAMRNMLFPNLGGDAAPVRARCAEALPRRASAELRARAAEGRGAVVTWAWTQLTGATSVPLTWSRRLWRVDLRRLVRGRARRVASPSIARARAPPSPRSTVSCRRAATPQHVRRLRL